jgi:hypothetical protein
MVLELMDSGNIWELLRTNPTNVDFFHLGIQVFLAFRVSIKLFPLFFLVRSIFRGH